MPRRSYSFHLEEDHWDGLLLR